MKNFLLAVLVLMCTSVLQKVFAQLPPGPGSTDSCDVGGLYYIGPNGYYASITEALDSLGKRGIGADVILELNAQYNSNVETFPITFPKTNSIKCYSYIDNYTVTIRPASNAINATITGSNTTAIFNLDSCRYVRIDGRPGGIDTAHLLTITNNIDAPVIAFFNASNNLIKYTNLRGGINSAGLYTGIVHLQGSKGIGCDYNTLYKCNLYGSITSPNAKAILLNSKNVPGFSNNNDSIIGCHFFNFATSAIQLDNDAEAWVISNNSFYSNTNINFSNEVSAIKINSTATAVPHIIDNNFFGSTQPLCAGNSMLIDYKSKFSWINVAGSTIITNNHFARQNFINTTNIAGSIDINMIQAADQTNGSTILIANNTFGSTNQIDSLHFNQAVGSSTVAISGILVNVSALYKIYNNTFNNVRCYSVNDAAINLWPINTIGGYADIKSNVIGNTNNSNSIINNTAGSTYGIACLLATTKINDNIICNISNNALAGSAGVLGIFTNNGSLDSVSRNTIFNFKNTIPTSVSSGSYSPLGGLSVNPTSVSGLGNTISDNVIYSLQNYSNVEGGSVIALYVSNNIFIKRNLIYRINNTGNNNVTIYGIYVKDRFSELENNMVSLGIDNMGNSITNGNVTIIGVSGGHVMRHNTIYIGGNNVAEGFIGSMCYEFLGNALPTNCFNNIFLMPDQMLCPLTPLSTNV